MSTLAVSVPVPVSGDGPAVDVSNIVGAKTVQLSGTFQGYFDLLASQDGASFTAVASFDSARVGLEGIKVTVAGAFKSVRLRAVAVNVQGVSCEVSGVLGAGENGFGTIASLPAGFSGTTASVDTSAFIPPDGSQEDTCFLCVGAFQGPIVVLGSSDGANFNPIGEFRVDRLPEGAPLVSQLDPLLTPAVVRYVKLQVPGATLGPVTVTMGGRVPATGGGGGGTNLAIVTSATAGKWNFQGATAAASPVTDVLGNTVVVPANADFLCLGQRNTINGTSSAMISVIGTGITAGATTAGSSVVALGDSFSYGDGAADDLLVIPGGGSIGANMRQCVILGHAAAIGDSAVQSTVIGTNNTIGASPFVDVVVGPNNTFGASDVNCVAVGNANSLADNASNCIAIGVSNAVSNAQSSGQILIGSGNTGGSSFAGTSLLIVGNTNVVTPTTNVTNPAPVVVGFGNNVTGNPVGLFLGGNGWNLSTDLTATTSNFDHSSVCIGYGGNVNNAASFTASVILGSPHVPNASNYDQLIALGFTQVGGADGVLLGQATTLGDGACAIGKNTTAGASSVAVGLNLGTGAGTTNAHLIGTSNVVGTGSSFLVVAGDNIDVGNSDTNIVALGNTHTLNAPNTLGFVVCIGAGGTVTGQFTDVVVMGNAITVAGNVPNGHASQSVVAIGDTQVLGDGSANIFNIVSIGTACNTGPNTNDIFMGGDGVQIIAGSQTIVALGLNLDTRAALGPVINSVMIGANMTVGTVNTMVMAGYNFAVSDGSQNSTILGLNQTVTGGAQSTVLIGSNSFINTVLFTIAVGDSLVVNSRFSTAMGADITIGTTSDSSVGIGHQNTIGNGAPQTVVVGYNSTVGNNTTGAVTLGNTLTVGVSGTSPVVLGTSCNIGDNQSKDVAIGSTLTVGTVGGTGGGESILLGDTITVPDQYSHVIAIGSNVTFTAGGTGAIGLGINVAFTNSTADAVSIGRFSSAGDNQCVIGVSSGVRLASAMNNFVVRGWNGGAFDTINVTNNPASGDSGLSLVYNAAGTFVQLTMKAVNVTAIGDLTGKLVCYLS